MNKITTNQFIATFIVVIVVIGLGLALVYIQKDPTSYNLRLTITADDTEAVAYGFPEKDFWENENGVIDWGALPHVWERLSFDIGDYVYEWEFWFRERFYNGTQWEYNNHGPFFVNWPQLSYSRTIELNNHTVYITITEM